jgi:transposase
MLATKYPVELTAHERTILTQMLRRGRHDTRRLTRARILLKAANGLRDHEIAAAVEASIPTVLRTRKRFAEGRLQALEEKPRPGKQRVLDARGEARLMAEACSTPPDGCEH